MKKLLVIVVLALLMASMVIAAGCSFSESDNDKQDGASENGTVQDGDDAQEDAAEYSVAGTYESPEGTYIALKGDGTFGTDAWGGMKDGTYLYTEDESGKWVDLAFEDGSSISLSVMIGNDEVAALVDGDTGTQYTRK